MYHLSLSLLSLFSLPFFAFQSFKEESEEAFQGERERRRSSGRCGRVHRRRPEALQVPHRHGEERRAKGPQRREVQILHVRR